MKHRTLLTLIVGSILVALLAACATAQPMATATPTEPPTATSTPEPTQTPMPTATNTLVPPTNTSVPPTNTPVPPTKTPNPPTATSVPPTATALPTPGPATTDFPTGVFVYGKDHTWEFRSDGTASWKTNRYSGEDTYKVTGNQIVITGDGCGDLEGLYTWDYDGTVLSFRVLRDPCADRRAEYGPHQVDKETVAAVC